MLLILSRAVAGCCARCGLLWLIPFRGEDSVEPVLCRCDSGPVVRVTGG